MGGTECGRGRRSERGGVRENTVSHTVNTFILFSKFLHLEWGSQCCVNTRSEPPAPKMHMHMPSMENAFWGHNIED